MQFIKRENSFSPAFSVWSIGRLANNLLPNSIIASGLMSGLQFIQKLFRLIFPILLLGIKLFEFKFYR